MANWVQRVLEMHSELTAWAVIKRARGSVHLRRPDGKILALFSGGPCHYQDEHSEWQPIDTTPAHDVARGLWRCPGLNVEITDEGVVRLGSYSQHTRQIGVFRPSSGRLIGGQVAVPLGNKVGDALVAENDDWRMERRITKTGYRERLTLKRRPRIPQAKAGDYLMLETTVSGVSLPKGWVEGEYNISEHWSPPPTAWDAKDEPLTCRRYWQDGVLYTGIPVTELAQAAYPIVIDPDFTGDTVDGQVRGRVEDNYLEARATSQSFATGETYIAVGQRHTEPYFYVYRGFLKFDTSAIGANPILQVNLVLTCQEDDSDTADFDVQIVKQDWSAQDPLSDGNREAAYDACLAGAQDDAIWRNTSGISINTNYPSPNLDITWPDPEGNTYYSLRSSLDKSASEPAEGLQYLLIYSKEAGTPEYQPFLTILYEEEAEGNPWYCYAQQQ